MRSARPGAQSVLVGKQYSPAGSSRMVVAETWWERADIALGESDARRENKKGCWGAIWGARSACFRCPDP